MSSSDATDGRAAALACSRADRMAPQLSRCHSAAACALLGLQPGAISQRPNKHKLLNVCLELPFVLSLGDSLTPKFYQQKDPHGGGARGATKPGVLARPDATGHEKNPARAEVFRFLRARARFLGGSRGLQPLDGTICGLAKLARTTAGIKRDL